MDMYGDADDTLYGGDSPYQEQQHTAYYGGRGVHNNPMHQVHATKIPPAYAGGLLMKKPSKTG